MTAKTKSALARLALFVLSENRFGFDMNKFVKRKDRNWSLYDPHTIESSLSEGQIESLCVAGHAPLVFGNTKPKQDWGSYLLSILAIGSQKDYSEIEYFLFHPSIEQTTRLQAAKRILYFLKNGFTEKEVWRESFYKTFYIKLSSARVVAGLEKFVVLDVALDS